MYTDPQAWKVAPPGPALSVVSMDHLGVAVAEALTAKRHTLTADGLLVRVVEGSSLNGGGSSVKLVGVDSLRLALKEPPTAERKIATGDGILAGMEEKCST